MFNTDIRRTILALCFMAITISACDRAADESTPASPMATDQGLLGYVPADTPYVFALVEPLPDDIADKFEPKVDALLKTYQDMLDVIVDLARSESAESEGEGISDEGIEVLQEMGSLLSIEGLESIGITRDSTIVLYGAGLLPVLRMTLTDGDLLEATIADFEQKANKRMSVATIDGQSYRYVGDEDATLVLAVMSDELVLSIVPTNMPDDLMKSVLGMTLPSSSIADSGELTQIVEGHGFLHFSAGLINIERIVATFIDDQTGINAELLKLMEHQSGELSDVCKAEFRRLASIAPRVVTGYTEMSVDRFSSNTILELRDDIAAGLAALTAPVPGLGIEQGGLFSFGMSIDLLAARDFYSTRLDAMQADPYECELLAELQQGVAQGREALNQPVPPIVYGFTGFLAVVEDIKGMDLANNQPPTSAELRVLVATDNAEGLLAMGAMFSPEIANLDLQPDGEPVQFESQQFAGMVDAAYVAMTDNALAISVGAGTEARLGDMLTAAIRQPHPFMSMEMDAARYYALIADAMAMEDTGDNPAPPELKAAMSRMVTVAGDMFSRMTIQVEFTERGVEFPSTMELSD